MTFKSSNDLVVSKIKSLRNEIEDLKEQLIRESPIQKGDIVDVSFETWNGLYSFVLYSTISPFLKIIFRLKNGEKITLNDSKSDVERYLDSKMIVTKRAYIHNIKITDEGRVDITFMKVNSKTGKVSDTTEEYFRESLGIKSIQKVEL